MKSRYFPILLSIIGVAVIGTVVGYNIWDDAIDTGGTGTVDDDGGVIGAPQGGAPASGRVLVEGTVTSVHIEGAIINPIPTPFTVTTPERGGGAGATITRVRIDDADGSIEWDAGTPLEVEGEGGALAVGRIGLDADPETVVVLLPDGEPQAFTEGEFGVRSPVAVSTGDQLGVPRDSVDFSTSTASTATFRGGATIALPARSLTAKGPGTVTLTGSLTVTYPDGTTASVSTVEFGEGAYELTLEPTNGGYTAVATFQGEVQAS